MGNTIEIKNLSKRYSLQEYLLITIREKIISALNNLFKSNKENRYFFALKNINLSIKKGEIVGLIGNNGAGKSTLLKIVSRIVTPTEGLVTLKGRVVSLLEVGTGFHSELTGRENIFLNGSILGMSKKEIDEKMEEIIDFSGIKRFIDVPVKKYSTGMFVRLAFSIAANLDSDILLIDEVLSVGDSEFQKKCLGKMNEVTKQRGRTIIFVSHDMESVKSLCDRCVLLENGTIKAEGETEKIVNLYLHKTKEFGEKKIHSHEHIEGSKNLEIVEISLSDINNNNNKKSFLLNEPIKINFDIKKNIEVDYNEKVSFFVLFYDKNKKIVLNSFQKDNEVGYFLTDNLKKVTLIIDPNILLPGEYTISAGILDNRNYFEDWVSDVVAFEMLAHDISGAKFDNRLGQVSMKYKWLEK